MLNAYPDAAKIPGVLIVASNQNAEGDLDLSRCKYRHAENKCTNLVCVHGRNGDIGV